MDRVKITTAQNVLLDFEAAGIGDRAIAALFDYILLFSYVIIAVLLVQSFESIAFYTLISIPYLTYFLVSEIMLNGQTVGKKMRNIKVVRLDGTSPQAGDYVIRWLFRFVEIDMIGGLLAVLTHLINGNGQRLGDMAAKTTVIKIKKPVRLEDTLYSEINPDYTPTFQEVTQLSTKEISLAREVLTVLLVEKRSSKTNEIGLKMKDPLEQKMGIKSELSPIEFLRVVIADFNYFAVK